MRMNTQTHIYAQVYIHTIVHKTHTYTRHLSVGGGKVRKTPVETRHTVKSDANDHPTVTHRPTTTANHCQAV
jgi:hypothetical protein